MADAKKIVGGLGKVTKALLADGEEAVTAAQRAEAGRKAAALIKSQPQVKASEALGQQMEKGVKRVTTTQADRTRVGGGNIGGAPFSAISEADPNYAGKVWGVMDEGTAARLKNLTDPETVWTTMLGSANQLKTNPVVFDKLKRQFLESMKQGNLSPELEAKINHNLALNFGEGANIRDPKIWREADTFEKRAALADLMMGQGIPPSKGGVALGGEKSGKGVIFKPTDTLKRETEPSLLHTEHGGEVPTFAAGPRLFKLEKESVYRPDLHPGFPTLLTGKDMNVNMIPTPTEIFLPDWHKAFKEKKPERFQRPWSPEIVQRRKSGSYEVKGEGPGYYDLALGLEGEGLPSQALNDEYIRHLLREGFKKGGAVDIDAADRRLSAAIQKRMAKGGEVDIKAADARLADAIAKRTGMAEGGEVGFKKIQFMNKGGKLVEGVTTIGKKLLASGEEAPKVDRLSMSYKDVTKRVPEVAEAIEKLNRGEITKAQYNDIVNLYKPVTPYAFVPKPATSEEAIGALRGDAAKARYGKQSEYEPGSKVGLRLDIPAYTGKGVWVNSIHDETAKKVAYGPVASVKNANLSASQNESKKIALGGAKAPYARIKGEWNPMNEEEAIAKAQEYLNHPEWKQIGFDPERHSYFYDRATMTPVTGAEEVIQIGPLVLGKNPKYGKIDDFEYADGGKIVKGGLNIARRLFKTTDGYTFKEMPDGRVTNGDMTWDSVKEFKQEMPHAFQQGDELGQRRANMESFSRPDPQNIPADTSKFMPDDAYAQFLRAYNKQNAPKPQLSVVPPEKKARGGLMMAGGGRPAGGESIQDTLKNIQNYSVLGQNAPRKPNELGGVVLSGASWLAGDEKTKLAKQAFGQDVTNTAVGGYKTADVLNQLNVFERDGGTFAPGTTVVLDIGANDIATGVNPEITRRNLDEIVSRLGDSGVSIILSAQPFANSFQEAIDNPNLVMNKMYSDIASNNPNVTLVDAMSGMLNRKDLMDESGFHLNSEDAKLEYINKFADAFKANNPTTQFETGLPKEIEQVVDTGTAIDIPQEIAQITQVDKPQEVYTPEAQVDFMPAVTEREPSAGYTYAQNNSSIDNYYNVINDYLAQERTQDEIQAAMEQYGVSQADIDAARDYQPSGGKFDESYATEAYADGGSAFKTIQWQKPQNFDGGGIASPEEVNPFEGSRREPLLTEKDWANIKRNAPEVYEWAKQNVKDEASQLKSARGVKDFALRTGAQYLGGIPDLVNLGLMGVDALADTKLSSEKPWFGSEQYIDALKRSGAVGENEFPIAETIAGVLAPAGLIKKGVKKVSSMRPAKEAPKKRRGGLTAMSR
jgi:acyl-CoA thioesterase-1